MTADATVTTSTAGNAPAWEAVSGEILCPLCDYNLRGLTEPRCPECGCRFDWADLLDPARRPHPYSFEHHPERNVRSFLRTYFGGLLPRRFFHRLRPTHPIRPWRLALYWLMATALFILAPVVIVGPTYIRVVRDELANRQWQRLYLARDQTIVRQYGSIDAYMKTWPSPYWGWWTREAVRQRMTLDRASLHAAAVALAWPWLTLATLMIFRASMRRAKVKAGHVARCTIYACDWTAWLGAIALALFTTPFAEQYLPYFYPRAAVPILAAALFALYTTYRLGSAYDLYLSFDRPYATAAAAQIVVFLFVAALFVIVMGT